MDNPEELEFAGNILFSSHGVPDWRCLICTSERGYSYLISGLFPILASTAAVSTATRASSSKDYRWGLRFCRKRWLNQQKTGYCRMQRNSISCCYICEQSDNDNKHRQRY